MKKLTTCVFSLMALAATPAMAEDIDVSSFEYVDVIETSDGSVLRGVVFEQEPGVKYKLATADGSIHVIQATDVVKLTKARNKMWRGHGGAPVGGSTISTGDGGGSSLTGRYERPGSGLPKPYAMTGLRTDFDLAIVFPGGDIDMFDTSFAPTLHFGYEALFGNFGLAGGGMTRFTYWMLPGDSGDAMWTLETHAYARASLHLGRVAPYLGASLGTDLNYVYDNGSNMSETALGFGTNLNFGVSIAATPTLALGFGGDYHPGTDTIVSGRDESVEYFALKLGAHLRL